MSSSRKRHRRRGRWRWPPAPRSRSPPRFHGIGRPATPKELAAWDIDVRPDFKGLPKGSGLGGPGHGRLGGQVRVLPRHLRREQRGLHAAGRRHDQGRREDRPRGPPHRPGLPGPHDADEGGHGLHAVGLHQPRDAVERAQVARAPTRSTPSPPSCSTWAACCPTTSCCRDANIAEVQKLLPNRNGMTTDHGLWPGKSLGNGGKPDVQGRGLHEGLRDRAQVASFLPDFARNAHGNLAEQNRPVGAQHRRRHHAARRAPPRGRGAPRPRRPPRAGRGHAADHQGAAAAPVPDLPRHGQQDRRPGARATWRRSTPARPTRSTTWPARSSAGGSGVWGPSRCRRRPCPRADAKAIAKWLAEGAKR